ncbi:sigma 54-interacting transcriptional regulator, partial [Bdellovibrionota bacterium]
MLNWDEFEHIHVIRKLKQILGRWWNAEVFFADDRGNLRAMKPDQEYKNILINHVLNKEKGIMSLADFAKQVTDQFRDGGEESLLIWWKHGGNTAVVPIFIKGEFLGAVVATGFFKEGTTSEKKEELREALQKAGIVAADITSSIKNMKTVREDEMGHFTELVDLVAREIITLHTEISLREERISELNKELGVRYRYDAMIGKSKLMQDLYSLLDKLQHSESTILITGENGTGKELIARALHYNSPRKEKTFVTQNCSAFNENLLDSELFGHVKGSFTGAVRDKKGLFEIADNGTFFLDEIADMSPSMQVKLLRVLQEGTFLPVGGVEPKKVDVRVIAATNKDLKELVERGEFREDLYYRINVINAHVPALRDRKDDIPLLIEHFLDKARPEDKKKINISKRALEKLFDYNWPGNVRELENEIERLNVLAGEENKITPDMLSPRIRVFGEKGKVQGVRV